MDCTHGTWIEKAVPSFILEVSSKKTAHEDQVVKKGIYQKLGVQEYFLFDPLAEYLPQQLMGYRMIQGKFRILPPAEMGELQSLELGLRFVPSGENLLVFEAQTGKRLLEHEDLYRRIAELEEEVKRLRGERSKRKKS